MTEKTYETPCGVIHYWVNKEAAAAKPQLVFLPGYPIVVRIVSRIVRDYVLSGMLVSVLCFAGALCVFYRLVLEEYSADAARRAAVFLCLMPGAFFFFAPMSESLFLLLSASCLYACRKRKWLLAGLFGALAAFTRSLGLMLFVPLFFEFVSDLLHGKRELARGGATFNHEIKRFCRRGVDAQAPL